MQEKEQWRDIPGYFGYYQVSDCGRVRSLDRIVAGKGGGEYELKGQIIQTNTANNYGYLSVTLRKRGKRKTFYVHKLIVLAWIGLYPPGQQVNRSTGQAWS